MYYAAPSTPKAISFLILSHPIPYLLFTYEVWMLFSVQLFFKTLTKIKHPHCTLIYFLYSYLPPLVYNFLTFPEITDIPHPAILLWVKKNQFSGLVTKIASALFMTKAFFPCLYVLGIYIQSPSLIFALHWEFYFWRRDLIWSS